MQIENWDPRKNKQPYIIKSPDSDYKIKSKSRAVVCHKTSIDKEGKEGGGAEVAQWPNVIKSLRRQL